MRLELGLGLGEFANRGPTPPVYDLVNFEPDVAAFQFACQRAVVRDTGTPANDHDGDCSILTVTRATGEGHFNEYGLFVWDATNDTLRFDHDPATVSASTTSVAIGTATKAFITDGAYTFVAGQTVQATDNASASNFIRGKVVAYDSTSFRLSIIPEVTGGSGTKADWTIIRCLGILTEAQQTNLLTYSEDMDNLSGWNSVNSATCTGTGEYLGASSTTEWFKIGHSGGLKSWRKNITVSAGTQYTASFYVKQDPTALKNAYASVVCNDGSASAFKWIFSFSTGLISTEVTAGTVTVDSASAEEIGDGGWRIWMTFTTPSGASGLYYDLMRGDVVAGATECWFAGPQTVTGAYRGSYIPTVASQVTRNADTVDFTLAEFPWNSGTGALEINGSSATAEDDGTYLEIADIASTESINWIETLTWVPS